MLQRRDFLRNVGVGAAGALPVAEVLAGPRLLARAAAEGLEAVT